MKSIRLNKQIRTEIVRNIIKAWEVENPKPECVKAPSKQMLLGVAYKEWRDSIGLDAKIKLGLPTEILHTTSYVNLIVVNAEGKEIMYEGLHFRNEEERCERRIFKKSGALKLTTDSPAYVEWKKQHDLFIRQNEEFKKWDVKRADKALEIHAVLDSVNTTKQLLEVWPEIERFMPNGYVDPSKVQLPSILPTLPEVTIKE